MNYRQGLLTGGGLASVLLFAGWWVFLRPVPEAAKSSPPPIPATIEANLNRVTLTEKAEESLGLKLGTVARQDWQRSRLYGGEVVIPPGQTIVVSAPFSALLETVGKESPRAGMLVSRGKPIFHLLPLLTPEGRANLATAKVDADGQVRNSETQVAAAEKNLARAKMLLQDDVGSKQRVEDAEAAFNIAQRTLEAAKSRAVLLAQVTGETGEGNAAPIKVESPATGILRNVAVAHGQNVPAGAVLFEVVDLSEVWIRVPVYGGDKAQIETRPAVVSASLMPQLKETTEQADWIDAPPSANPLTGTVDLYYQMGNRTTQYSPGQRVGVKLALKGADASLTIPWAALLYDIQGGTWVYEKTGKHAYTRRRVIVREVQKDIVYLAEGPPVGTPVVTDGAIELFGTETGYSK